MESPHHLIFFSLFLTSDESTLEVFKTALCGSMQRQDQAKGFSKGMWKDQPNPWGDSDCSWGSWLYIWYSFFHNYLVASCLFTIYKNQGVPWDNRNNLSSLHMVPSQHSQGIPKYLHLYFPNGAISGPGHLNWPMLFVQDQDSWAAGNGWTFKLRFMAMLKSVCTVQDITDVFFSSLDNLLKGSCV